MVKYLYEGISIVIGVVILIANHFYLGIEYPIMAPMLNIIGALIAVAPPSLLVYTNFRTKREMEEQFLVFIGDLTDSINTGMTLPMALEHSAKSNYRALNKHINRMASEVNWGIPFEKALKIFSENVDILMIKRAVTTIIETYKVGGKVSDTLNAVGKSLITINRIKKERSLSVHSQIITSYLIFFVFIFILIVLQVFLIPALIPAQQAQGLGVYGETTGIQAPGEAFTASFINFIVVQGFFAGLVTGKMSENSIIAGIKHSILLIAIGYTLFAFASQFPISLF